MAAPTPAEISARISQVLVEERQRRSSGEVVLRIGLNAGSIARATIARPDEPVKARADGFDGRAEHDGPYT